MNQSICLVEKLSAAEVIVLFLMRITSETDKAQLTFIGDER